MKKKVGGNAMYSLWRKLVSVTTTSSSSKHCSLDDLPDAILLKIFSRMSFHSIFRLRIVCKRFAILLSNDSPAVYVSPALLITFTLKNDTRRARYAVCDEQGRFHVGVGGSHCYQIVAVGNGVLWNFYHKPNGETGWYVCNLTSSSSLKEVPIIECFDLIASNYDFFALCFDPLSSFCMLIRAPSNPSQGLVDIFDFAYDEWVKIPIPAAAQAMSSFYRDETVFVGGKLFWFYKDVSGIVKVGILRVSDRSFTFADVELPRNACPHWLGYTPWILSNCLDDLVLAQKNIDDTEDYWKLSSETGEWQFVGNSHSHFALNEALWNSFPPHGVYYGVNKRDWIWQWSSPVRNYGCLWITKLMKDMLFIEDVRGKLFFNYANAKHVLLKIFGANMHQVKGVWQIQCYSNLWPAHMP